MARHCNRAEPRNPSDLAAHDTLLYSYYSEGRAWSFEGPKGPVTVALEPRYRSNNALALREVALGGGGILRVPTFIVGDDLATFRLERVLPRWRLPGIDVHAVFPARAYVPLKARAFLEFLLGHLKEQKFWT